jgi:hypothetical protein
MRTPLAIVTLLGVLAMNTTADAAQKGRYPTALPLRTSGLRGTRSARRPFWPIRRLPVLGTRGLFQRPHWRAPLISGQSLRRPRQTYASRLAPDRGPTVRAVSQTLHRKPR